MIEFGPYSDLISGTWQGTNTETYPWEAIDEKIRTSSLSREISYLYELQP